MEGKKEDNLTRQLKAVWRFKWMIVLLVLIAGSVAFPRALTSPPVYAATATINVQSEQPTVELPTGLEIKYLEDIGNQLELMNSRSVLENAVRRLEPEKSEDPNYLLAEIEELQSSLSFEQIGKTNLATIIATAYEAPLAQRRANALAEAYIYTVNKARLIAIENAIEETSKQLKELSTGKIDISISPLLSPLLSEIDTTLLTLEEVSLNLKNILALDIETFPEYKRLRVVILESKELSTLAENLISSTSEIALMESQTRALSIKLETLSTGISAIRRSESDTQIYGVLLEVEELVQVAGVTGDAVLSQVLALSETYPSDSDEKTYITEIRENLKQRIVQHIALIVNNLETATEMLDEMVSLTKQPLDILTEKVAYCEMTLQTLLRQLKPPSSESTILLSRAELTSMENNVRRVANVLTTLLSEVKGLRSDKLYSQSYNELTEVSELLEIANETVRVLPNEISDISESGGGSLSFSALSNLREELQLALLTGDTSGVSIVDIATGSSILMNPFMRYRMAILAVVAALLLGILIALVLQYLDHTVRDASQVIMYTEIPLMGNIHLVRQLGGHKHMPSILTMGSSQFLEDFRILRTNLKLDSYKGEILLVSGSAENEGNTTIASNLARVVAIQERRVLLIDGNLRKPDVAKAFGLSEAEVSYEPASGGNRLWENVTQVDGVDILAPGTPSAGSAEILSSPRFRKLLEEAKQTYDVVIVDSAPITGYADSRILAKDVDNVLLVLQQDTSRLDLALESKQLLETMGARVVGFVLNKKSNSKEWEKGKINKTEGVDKQTENEALIAATEKTLRKAEEVKKKKKEKLINKLRKKQN